MAGLKTLAKELQSKGRNGDTILAHINPQEAGILKALGGSGTRNPDTGLPEYFKIGNPFKPVQRAIGQLNPLNPGSGISKTIDSIPVVGEANRAINKLGTQVFQPLEKAIVQPVSRGLADFDKAVGNTIPGGWGTVGSIALSAMGAPMPLQIGYGAARGSGVMRKGGNFNLQGAVIGGATAYATAELGEYLRAAAPGADATLTSSDVALLPVSETGTAVGAEGINAATGELGSGLVGNASGYLGSQMPPSDVLSNISGYDVGAPLPAPQSIGSQIMRGNFSDVASRGLANLQNMGTSAVEGVTDFGKAAINPETYTGAIDKGISALDKGLDNASQTGSGLKNLLTGPAGTSKAAAAASGVNPMSMGALAIYGETNLAGLDEQRKYLEEAKRANAISQAEYDQAMDSINRQRDYADKVVRENPFNPNPNRDVSIGETYYGRSDEGENLYDRFQDNLYAMGGQVDDELGGDYSAMGMDQGNLQKGLFGMGYAAGGMPNLALSRLSQPAFNEGAVGGMQQFAEGGTPRFLSGGGDGMSDSIKATINDSQPARLADGEFVIPADVVSHLGNGSSKAGAKQLYSMMDKVRKARTGNPKQGKQINPRKYMPA
jgi:hypothetical protein